MRPLQRSQRNIWVHPGSAVSSTLHASGHITELNSSPLPAGPHDVLDNSDITVDIVVASKQCPNLRPALGDVWSDNLHNPETAAGVEEEDEAP